jgi:hypothetical protein
LGVLFVGGVGLVGFGGVVVLGHAGFLFPVGLVRWMRMRGGGMYWVGIWFDQERIWLADLCRSTHLRRVWRASFQVTSNLQRPGF